MNLLQMLGMGGMGMGGNATAAGQQSGLQRLLSPEMLMAMGSGLMGNQGNMNNVGQAMANAVPVMAMQRQTQAQTAERNKTLDYFRANSPEYAAMIEAGMEPTEALSLYARQRFAKPEKGQGFINAGGGHLYDTETGQWVSAPGGGSEGTAGLMPVWLQDEQGNPVLGQMTKDGKVIRSEMDEGLTPVGPYQKSFETKRGEAAGKATGEAAGALPGASMTAQRVAQQVEDLKTDPYLENMLGPVNSRLPNVTQDSARVQGRLNQLQGGAFLEARQALKGGGAITDYEGQKAEQAYARLNQAQSPEDFRAALDEFNYYVQQGLAKLQAQASQQQMGGGYPGAAPAAPGPQQRYRFNPQTGEIE